MQNLEELRKEIEKLQEIRKKSENYRIPVKTKPLSYEERVIEYVKKINKTKRNINKADKFLFSDNVKMYDWYCNESKKIMREVKENKTLTKKRLEEIMMFSKIDYTLYELNNAFKIRVYQYINMIKKLGRNLRPTDKFTFKDGVNMYNWYVHTSSKIKQERKNNIKIDDDRLEEIMVFDKIRDVLSENKKASKQIIFYSKMKEYVNKIISIRRNITKKDNFRFTDGTSMKIWLDEEKLKLRKYTGDDEQIKQEIDLFKRIDRILEKCKLNDYSKKVSSYIKKINELGRNIRCSEKYAFSDNIYLYYWYINESKKLRNEYKKHIIPSEERLEEIMMFSKIDDTLHDLKMKRK